MRKTYFTLLFIVVLSTTTIAQTDSLASGNSIVQDTIVEQSSEKKSYKRASNFKVYGGISASEILLSNSAIESAYAGGFILGLSYKKGRYGYWEIGLNYNGSIVGLESVQALSETMDIRQFELPISAGVNLFAGTERIFGLRLFGGLVPGYITSVGSNQFNLSKDDFNQFQLDGRVGVGVDVLFLFVEGGYQYGIIDLLKEQESHLSQFTFLLGFRF